MSYTPHNELIEEHWPDRQPGDAWTIALWLEVYTGEDIEVAQEPLLLELGGVIVFCGHAFPEDKSSVTSLSGGYSYGYGPVYDATGSGAFILSEDSSSYIQFDATGSGAFILSGDSTASFVVYEYSPMACAGCAIDATGSGGFTLSGSADVRSNIFYATGSGTFQLSGRGIPSLEGEVFDDFVARYRLDDDSTTFLDSSPNELHGTSENPPELVGGLLCQGASRFEEEENGTGNYITLPQDPIASDKEWSVSLWVKLEETFQPRTLYSRGHNELGNRWVFSLETSLINHIVLSVNTDEGSFDAFSDSTLGINRWYHVAASVKGSTMKTFINGVEQTSYEFEGTPLPLTNGGYIGRKNNGGHPTATMNRIHVWHEAKPVEWFLAEYQNICLPGCLLIGSEQST